MTTTRATRKMRARYEAVEKAVEKLWKSAPPGLFSSLFVFSFFPLFSSLLPLILGIIPLKECAMKLSSVPPFRVWNKSKQKMFDVIGWTHPDFGDSIILYDHEREERVLVRRSDKDFLFFRYSYMKDSNASPIFEQDILLVIHDLPEGMGAGALSLAVISVDGVIGVYVDNEHFIPLAAIEHVVPGVKGIFISGNAIEFPVYPKKNLTKEIVH